MGKDSHKQKYTDLPLRSVPTQGIKAMVKNKATARLCCIFSWSGLFLSFSLSPQQTWPYQGGSYVSISHRCRSSSGFPWILLGLDPGTRGLACSAHCSGHGVGRDNMEWASAVLAQTLFLAGALLGPCFCTGFALVVVYDLLLTATSTVMGCSSGRARAQQLWTPGCRVQVQWL